MTRKFAYSFSELDQVIKLIGGTSKLDEFLGPKGASLSHIMKQGISVPPGFVITAETCKEFYKQTPPSFPPGMWEEILALLHKLEEQTGKKLGNSESPLFVSCRGTQSILNLGMTDDITLSLVSSTSNPKFAWTSYARLIESYGTNVFQIPSEYFADELKSLMGEKSELPAEECHQLVECYKRIIESETGSQFPQDPIEQIRSAIAASIQSSNTSNAVIIQQMVFGNMNDSSSSGFLFTRNPETGEARMSGEFAASVQGLTPSDVKRGEKIEKLPPEVHKKLEDIAKKLEKFFKNAQQIDFTVENGTLWILGAKNINGTPTAVVKIAVDMVNEGIISREEALKNVSLDDITALLYPVVKVAIDQVFAQGVKSSCGAVVGQVCFTPEKCRNMSKAGKKPILMTKEVRDPEIIEMVGGIVTKGGSRYTGIPMVTHCVSLDIDEQAGTATSGAVTINEGDYISIDGATGRVLVGQAELTKPNPQSIDMKKILEWADGIRHGSVYATVNKVSDIRNAKENGCQGIVIERLSDTSIIQKVVLDENNALLDKYCEQETHQFTAMFREAGSTPVVVQLPDLSVCDILPDVLELVKEVTVLQTKKDLKQPVNEKELEDKRLLLSRIQSIKGSDADLTLRGTRLFLRFPQLLKAHLKAILDSACTTTSRLDILAPLICHENELAKVAAILESTKQEVAKQRGKTIQVRLGAKIDTPRAALITDRLANHADFVVFGTNTLTDLTFGFSRGLFDEEGAGKLITSAVDALKAQKKIDIGLCSDDPQAINFCQRLGFNYVSCSPCHVAIARLSGAHK